MQIHSRAYLEHLELITEQLAQLGPTGRSISGSEAVWSQKMKSMEDGYLGGQRILGRRSFSTLNGYGSAFPPENGFIVRLPRVTWWEQLLNWQKTGFFIDQRDNSGSCGQALKSVRLASGKNVPLKS